MGPARRASRLEVEPGACYQPEVLQHKRLWGFMVQLYGLRSERNWGIGDFTDLRNLADIAASLGAGVIGVNPLHATQGSPYSPSSRHALNVLYIDVEAVPGFEGADKLRKRLASLRQSELVDYEGVRRVKLEALEAIFKKTKPKVQVAGNYPVFEALREKFGGGWQSWSKQYQSPDSPAVKSFAKKNANRVAFHAWMQQVARAQLEAVQRHTQDLGMPLGLYVDLALGADRGGAEVWSDQDAFAVDALVRRAARRIQSARPGLGAAAVFAARAAREGLPAVHRPAARQHAGAAARCAWTTSWRSRASGGSRRARRRSAAAT